ncbi:MAG: flagellar basal body-associated FliL family protein [Bacteroidota bacterium]
MAKEATAIPATAAAPTAEAPKSDSINIKKVLIIGIPIIVVQIVLLYFLFIKFVAPGMTAQPHVKEEASVPDQTQVMVIKDIIVNPAGTNGTRFLLTTVGLEIPSAELKAELETKEVQTRDILNTILTSKGLDELTAPQFKEQLRKEILEKLNSKLTKGKIKNIYFSKFIIQ